jgi:hypothetical protein
MLIGIAVAVVVFLAALVGGLFIYQQRLVFVPSRDIVLTPGEVNLKFEEVFLEVAPGEKIHLWYFPVEGAEKTVLFCHGNAGNISHRVYTAQFFTSLGVNVLLFDYRGYGRSDGSPSEANVYADALAAWNWLTNENQRDPKSIIVFGRSLGGAIAIDLAARVDCGGLIVESSFTTARDMGRELVPAMPAWLMTRFSFDSAAKIRNVGCPVLVSHSPDDELIPFRMGEQLFAAAPEPKEMLILSGGHNDRGYYDSDVYVKGLQRFMGLAEDSAN